MRKAKKMILNAIILTITSLIIRGINIIFTVYISKKIGAEGMGVFQLLMSVYVLSVTFATSGIGLATTRLVAEEMAVGCEVGVKSVVKKCFYYSLFFSVSTAGILFLSAPLIATYWMNGTISVFPIYALALSLPFLALSSVLVGYFTAIRKVSKSASAKILEEFIKITLIVFGLNVIAPKGIQAACFTLVISGMLAEMVSFVYLFILYFIDKSKQNCAKKGKDDGSIDKRLLHISLPVAVSSYIRSCLGTYKQFMIPTGIQKSGVSFDVAISQYGMVCGMVMPILFFPSAILGAFSTLLIPEIAEQHIQKNDNRIDTIISRIFKITLVFSVCVSGILFVYAEPISMEIYKNTQVAQFIKVFAPLILIMYLDDIVDAILKGLNEQVYVVGVNIFDTILSIVLFSTLLPRYGIGGYVIVFFISEICNAFLSIKRLMQVTKFKFRAIDWVIIPIITMIIALTITRLLSLSNLLLSVLVCVGIYFTILYAVGGISKKDLFF